MSDVSAFWTAPQALAWILGRDLVSTSAVGSRGDGLRRVREWHHQQRGFRLRDRELNRSFTAVEAAIDAGNLGFRTDEETSAERINALAEAGAASAVAEITKAECDRAERELLAALQTGRIAAIGKRAGAASYEAIPASAWLDLVFAEPALGTPGCFVAGIEVVARGPWSQSDPQELSDTASKLYSGTPSNSLRGWIDLRFPSGQLIEAFPPVASDIDLAGAVDLWAAFGLAETSRATLQAINTECTTTPAADDTGAAARRGNPGTKTQTIKAQMRSMDRKMLRSMKEEVMASTFGAARSTCRTARKEVLAENGEK